MPPPADPPGNPPADMPADPPMEDDLCCLCRSRKKCIFSNKYMKCKECQGDPQYHCQNIYDGRGDYCTSKIMH